MAIWLKDAEMVPLVSGRVSRNIEVEAMGIVYKNRLRICQSCKWQSVVLLQNTHYDITINQFYATARTKISSTQRQS